MSSQNRGNSRVNARGAGKADSGRDWRDAVSANKSQQSPGAGIFKDISPKASRRRAAMWTPQS